MDPYDLFPYERIAFPESHPNHLAVLARLLGLPAKTPAEARVLELGCGEGNNLIPMAYHLPSAHFLGIDPSRRKIQRARDMAEKLALKNIAFFPSEYLDLHPELSELGQFDYVIAHRVYSWVSPEVRRHLLALFPRLLQQNGILYLRYNSFPGWHLRAPLRDLLQYVCKTAHSPMARIATARKAMQRLYTALQGNEMPSARLLQEEIQRLQQVHPNYLFSEYLGEHNQPFLFHEFAVDIARAGLYYLCDTEVSTLFPSNYGEHIGEALASVEDKWDLEQWLDFATNRANRQSLLCRVDASLPSVINIHLNQFVQLAFRSDLRPTETPDLRRVRDTAFLAPHGQELYISHPLAKAVVLQLSRRFPSCPRLMEVLPTAMGEVEVAGGGDYAQDLDACLQELFSLYTRGAIAAQPEALRVPAPQLELPALSPLTRVQLEAGLRQVSTIHHDNLELDSFSRRLMQLLDGSRNEEQLTRHLTKALREGMVQAPRQIPLDPEDEHLFERVRRAISALLVLFAREGLLN